MKYQRYVIGLSGVILSLIVAFYFIKKTPEKKGQAPSRFVKAALVQKKDLIDFIPTNGRLVASQAVDIVPQVSGTLKKKYVHEGDFVKKGQLLFEIDSESYQASLNQAQALVRADEINLDYAQKTVARYQELAKDHYVSQSDYDSYIQNEKTSQATLDADKASLQLAQINVNHCFLYAHCDGKIGKINFDEGSYLIQGSSSTPLTQIKMLDPLYVEFTLAEKTFLNIQHDLGPDIEVKVFPFGRKNQEEALGHLSFIDHSVDEDTGTMSMKATIPNPKLLFWPGEFVTVHIHLRLLHDQLLVPVESVLVGPDGYYIFVVNEQKQASYRLVSLGKKYDEGYHILSGIHEGEYVVTQGQLNLDEGTHVTILGDHS